MEFSFFIVLACGVTLILILLSVLKKYNDLRDTLARLETENNSMEMKKNAYEAEIGALSERIAEYTKEYMLLERELAESRQVENERALEQERYKYMSFTEYLISQGHINEDDVTKAEIYKKKNVSSMSVAEVLVLFNRIPSDDMKIYREEFRAVTGQ
ncbi:coiled-coil domain-containing protein [Halodesulfovibrio marinisediminis]|uniref:Uncharacterized protein n=1 Tax=Halodesulfovibrio marinisediminis DSM 17456 TaxID=1121457 RepID=A0A1N6I3Y0_9BACT|nr:hypothetical protein [Halodesulfovibrio marinisediminis]SIO26703.1 hypothetical protein SAMN02745161_2393 [Halodesulfovibrio marinisediminis DSM 17456]